MGTAKVPVLKVLTRPAMATKVDILRVMAALVLLGGLVVAILVPVQSCVRLAAGDRCATGSFWQFLVQGDFSEPGVDFRWLLRVGLALAASLGALALLAVAQRQQD